MPIILPMIGVMAKYPSDESFHCYIHGYTTSRLMKLGADPTSEGLPVCIAGTQVDGIVLSLTPNTHDMNYRSAVLQGVATIVNDSEERLWAMEQITNSVLPGRWGNTRVPPDNTELTSTKIMKVSITAASGKLREGMPHDERKDMKREDVLNSVWTGVVPVSLNYGEPVPGPYNRIESVPEHVKGFVNGGNEKGKQFAIERALIEEGKKLKG